VSALRSERDEGGSEKNRRDALKYPDQVKASLLPRQTAGRIGPNKASPRFTQPITHPMHRHRDETKDGSQNRNLLPPCPIDPILQLFNRQEDEGRRRLELRDPPLEHEPRPWSAEKVVNERTGMKTCSNVRITPTVEFDPGPEAFMMWLYEKKSGLAMK
jgi:hypothetical protein